MSATQRFITEYLVAELYHILGSYGSASKIYTSLWEKREQMSSSNRGEFLDKKNRLEIRSMYKEEILREVNKFNLKLYNEIHATRSMEDKNWKNHRHPGNELVKKSNMGVWVAGEGFGEKLKQILYFYEAALTSLNNEDYLSYYLKFETTIPSRHTYLDADFLKNRREQNSESRKRAKLSRFKMLLQEAEILLVSKLKIVPEENHDQKEKNINDCIDQLCKENLSYNIDVNDESDNKATSIRCILFDLLNASHLMIHKAEHLRSFGYEEQMSKCENTLEEIRTNLPLAICINTFVYNIARNIPWIFAADDTERDYIQKLHKQGSIYQMPPRCMWIAIQVSLLALCRRAYARSLLGGEVVESFNDYLKVQKLTRVARKIYDRTATPVGGGRDWLDALESMTEYRMGELYRIDHAHNRAFGHFCRGYERLDNLTHSDDMRPVIEESHIRIKLMLSKGKGFYELGYLKRSLKWYIRAWKSFLVITSRDGDLEINDKSIDDLIQWLERIKYDPNLSKRELVKYLEPLIRSIESTRVSLRLQGLAADILNRLAHCLYVLKLGILPKSNNSAPQYLEGRLHDLSRRILKKAYFLDKKNTLIKSNYLKTVKESKEEINNLKCKFDREAESSLIGMQWPHAKNEFERFARLYEHYLLQNVIVNETDREAGDEASLKYISSSMLVDFLSHTDSINVKLAQTYRYLMRESTPGLGSTGTSVDDGKHADSEKAAGTEGMIEFVCLRRYSSFFPFLPRPSAFDVLGGGYLLRIYGNTGSSSGWYTKRSPLGIAVDPGPNFIDNLYRTGFSLEDIDLIIVTHDHPDHMSSLDPLLSLIQYKSTVGGTKFKSAPSDDGRLQRPLPVICNKSVYDRYAELNTLYEKKLGFVRFSLYENWKKSTDINGELLTRFYREIDNIGLKLLFNQGQHKDTSLMNDSLGVKISITNGGPSVGITSDTGYFGISEDGGAEAFKLKDESKYLDKSNIENDEEWTSRWNNVLNSDLLITHVSSIPLPQLRHFSGVGNNSDWKKNTDWLKDVTVRLEKMPSEKEEQVFYKQILNQIDFAFWIEKDKRPLFGDSDLPDVPGNHLYLAGIYKFAEEYLRRRRKCNLPGLFIVSELREELATFRTKIASNLNKLFNPEKSDLKTNTVSTIRAVTADIGLTVIVRRGHNPEENIKILCGSCNIDNDYSNSEKYHSPKHIVEVCIKGEDEGIFYNCKHHDPGSQTDSNFVERLERYDIFGRLQP